MDNKQQQDINYLIIVLIVLLLTGIAILSTGCRGPAGHEGPQGIQGIQGNTGAQGSTGQTGATGATGQTGAQGPVGVTTPVYTSPATPAECPNGGLNIIVGSVATAVCNGQNGTNGMNGTNATPLEFIQFCQGFTPNYPGTFPEYGIVYGTQVYGVYSANGGFLALLPPGEYSSDGINASCTFTINADGTVTQ
jgi:hypothetical protein